MAALEVNQIEVGHPDERGDCAMVALKVYLGIKYTDVIRDAVRRDPSKWGGRRGLFLETILQIAADFGHTLAVRPLTEDSYGIICSSHHAAVVRNQLVIDRDEIYPIATWLRKHKSRRDRVVVLEAVKVRKRKR